MPLTIRYQFTQILPASAKRAFEWCTSFDPQDHALMGEEGAERQVTHVTDTTLILRDAFTKATGKVEKEKLVQLYPDQLFWVSTHLTGPNKHSQFLYQISPVGEEASALDFTGLHLDYEKKTGAKALSEKLCREDADAWKLLAKAMAAELKK